MAELVTIADETTVRVAFDELYEEPEIGDFCLFPMKAKRNFAGMINEAALTIAEICASSERFTAGLLAIRFQMELDSSDQRFISEEEFPAAVQRLFMPEAEQIRNRVNGLYDSNSVDIDTDYSGRENPELQFTNDHARVILQWSYACAAATPLITTLMEIRRITSRDSSRLVTAVFYSLLDCFQPEGMDIASKIRTLVESRIVQTQYTDRVMWNYLENVSLNPRIYFERLVRKFVAECIPKLKQGTNIIRFFHTFLRNQLRFLFTQRFTLSFRPIRNDAKASETGSAMGFLEAELVRGNEGNAIIGDIIFEEVLDEVADRLKWEPSEQEIGYWSRVLFEFGINDWQRSIVVNFFLPLISNFQTIQTRTLVEYTKMFLLVREWLRQNRYVLLYDYMSSYVSEGGDATRINARRRFVRDFTESKAYMGIINAHYAETAFLVDNSGVIINMIGSIHSATFKRIPEMPADEELLSPESMTIVSHPIDRVAQETVRFISVACVA